MKRQSITKYPAIMRHPKVLKLLRFGTVGALGTIINTAVYYVLTIYIGVTSNMAAIAAFFVAITHNYLLNHAWTFATENKGKSSSIQQYGKYVVANLGGLVGNLIVLNLIMISFGYACHLWGQFLGIFAGTLFNYILISRFVFTAQKKTHIPLDVVEPAMTMVDMN